MNLSDLTRAGLESFARITGTCGNHPDPVVRSFAWVGEAARQEIERREAEHAARRERGGEQVRRRAGGTSTPEARLARSSA